MNEQRPTREQWLAVNQLQQDIAVTAGAGSGKTWVLTRRYLTQIAGRQIVPNPLLTDTDRPLPAISFPEPVAPDQIIAITFTEKAATEMKERIRSELQKLYREAEQAEQTKWQLYMDEVESAMITTIHGLCARLIRQYPLRANINPNFSVLEPHEADELFEQAVEQVITDGLDDQQDFVLTLLREYPMYSFRKAIRQLFDQLRELHDPHAWTCVLPILQQRLEVNKKIAVEKVAQVLELGDLVHASQPETSKTVMERQMAESFHPFWQTWRKELSGTDGIWTESLRQVVRSIADVCKWRGQLPKSYKESLPLFVAALQEWSKTMCSPQYEELCAHVIHLLIQIERSYQALKHKQHMLDFTDMQILAVRLLQNPDIRAAITRKIRYVMVDEFQDTNHMQAQLVRSLAERARLFIVGDAKQSIYGFRQADVGVFIHLQNEIRTARGGQLIEMRHNFRTVSPIINFVNRFFSALMDPQATAAETTANYRVAYDAGMLPTREPADDQQRVELIHLPLDTEEAEQDSGTHTLTESKQARLQEAEVIAKRILALCTNEKRIVESDPLTGQPSTRNVRYGDITLLFSAMTHVNLYEFMLQKYDIPYYVVGSRNFYQRQEIIDILHVLRLLIDSKDHMAWAGALRSPLFAVSDEGLFWMSRRDGLERLGQFNRNNLPLQLTEVDRTCMQRALSLIKQWRNFAVYASVSEIVERIVTDSGVRQILIAQFGGTQKVGNIDKLIEVSRRFQNEKNGSLFGFVRFLTFMVENVVDETDAEVTSLDEDVVKIMTIHQSKGLEFPIVILPDLARQPRPDSFIFAYHEQKGLGLKLQQSQCTAGSGAKLLLLDGSGLAEELQAEKSDRVQQEERRKLYVALTRARDYLILVASKKPPKDAKSLALTGSNWFHWFVSIVADGNLDQLPDMCENFGVRYLTPEFVEDLYAAVSKELIKSDIVDDREADGGTPDTLKIPLQLPQTEVIQAHLNSKSYQTASMMMAEREDFERFVRVFQLGLPDWQEWNFAYHTTTGIRHATTMEDPKEDKLSASMLGSIVHRICEKLTNVDNAKGITQQVLAEFGQPTEETGEVYQQVWQLIERYIASEVFQKVCTAAEVHSEIPFRVNLEGHIVSGIIDKLLIDSKGKITVLDFKTNQISESNRKQLIATYQVQLDLYRQALEAIYGKPVQTKLVFVREL